MTPDQINTALAERVMRWKRVEPECIGEAWPVWQDAEGKDWYTCKNWTPWTHISHAMEVLAAMHSFEKGFTMRITWYGKPDLAPSCIVQAWFDEKSMNEPADFHKETSLAKLSAAISLAALEAVGEKSCS